MGKEKDTAWFETYKELVKTVIDFIVPKNETICDWTGSQAGEGAKAFFESIVGNCMKGDFAVSIPATAGASTQAAAKPTHSTDKLTGHGTDFRAAMADVIKTLQANALVLAIPQVTKVSEQFIELVNDSSKVMDAQARFKKPADTSFLTRKMGELFAEIDTVARKDFKAPPNHIKTVLDGI